jgi:choline dehydrogenase
LFVYQQVCRQESSETGFLQPALRKGNLIVYQSTLAKRILFSGNKTATGVLVETGGSQYTISAKRSYTFSQSFWFSANANGIWDWTCSKPQKHDIPIISRLPGVGQNMCIGGIN